MRIPGHVIAYVGRYGPQGYEEDKTRVYLSIDSGGPWGFEEVEVPNISTQIPPYEAWVEWDKKVLAWGPRAQARVWIEIPLVLPPELSHLKPPTVRIEVDVDSDGEFFNPVTQVLET
jgi:hypothetical protein